MHGTQINWRFYWRCIFQQRRSTSSELCQAWRAVTSSRRDLLDDVTRFTQIQSKQFIVNTTIGRLSLNWTCESTMIKLYIFITGIANCTLCNQLITMDHYYTRDHIVIIIAVLESWFRGSSPRGHKFKYRSSKHGESVGLTLATLVLVVFEDFYFSFLLLQVLNISNTGHTQ